MYIYLIVIVSASDNKNIIRGWGLFHKTCDFFFTLILTYMYIPDFTQHASCLSFSKQVLSTHVSVVTSYSSTSATLVSSGSDDDLSIETPPQRNSECPTAIRLAWQRPYRTFRFGVHLINKIKFL